MGTSDCKDGCLTTVIAAAEVSEHDILYAVVMGAHHLTLVVYVSATGGCQPAHIDEALFSECRLCFQIPNTSFGD
jgi:hypothetical protein